MEFRNFVADLEFLVEVILFGGEVEAGHGECPLFFRAVALEEFNHVLVTPLDRQAQRLGRRIDLLVRRITQSL